MEGTLQSTTKSIRAGGDISCRDVESDAPKHSISDEPGGNGEGRVIRGVGVPPPLDFHRLHSLPNQGDFYPLHHEPFKHCPDGAYADHSRMAK